jgi:cell division protein FtsL
MKWWKTHKEKNQKILDLENQIKLMQDHIAVQNKENLSLNKQIRELEMLLDIANNTKRY